MKELIDNLLELTNLRLGSGMAINKSPVDLSKQSEKIVQELQLSYPEVEINIESPGPVQYYRSKYYSQNNNEGKI